MSRTDPIWSLDTDRLVLRHLVPGDAEFIRRLLNEPSFLRFIGDKRVRTLEDAREYLESGPLESYRSNGFGLNLVSTREPSEPIGICGLIRRETLPDVDLGFAFVPESWRRGYALESAGAVLEQAWRELRFRRILAITSPDNEASIALLEKLGFRFQEMTGVGERDACRLFAIERAWTEVSGLES